MPDLAIWPALALAAFGAFLDIRERRLPNWLCGALFVAAGAGLAFSQGWTMLPWGLLHAAIALVVGMGLFALGAIGGGDAKFYAAAAFSLPAVPASQPIALLGWTSLAGLFVLIAMMIWRRTRNRGESRRLLQLKGWGVPYGVAIAAGLWLTFLVQ